MSWLEARRIRELEEPDFADAMEAERAQMDQSP